MDFSIHELAKLLPEAVRWMEALVPRELQGIVVVVIVLIAIIVFLYWHYSHVGPPMKFAANKYANRRAKVRQGAETMGFEIEEVDREIAQFSKSNTLYSMSSGKCARYRWREPLGARGKWELLCRPGEYSSSVGVLGWIVQGTPDETQKQPIANAVAELGEPKEFFEIGYDGSQLSFYWNETGGMDGLIRVKMLLDHFVKER